MRNRFTRCTKSKSWMRPMITVGIGAIAGSSPAWAQDVEVRRNLYVGAFGGIGRSMGQEVRQRGTAFRRGDFALPGFRDFDLEVDVAGRSAAQTNSLFGIQFGYRFDDGVRKLIPALEIEGLRLSSSQQSSLANPSDEVVANLGSGGAQDNLADPRALVQAEYGAGRHRFDNRIRAKSNLLMANTVFGYRLSSRIEPYVGAGAGVAFLSMRGARSLQTNPFGPVERTTDTHEDVNHFNSDTHDTAMTYALQAKAGVRIALTQRLSAFVEYRYIRIGAADFAFGATTYTGHAPTDRWSFRAGPTNTHSGFTGVRLAF